MHPRSKGAAVIKRLSVSLGPLKYHAGNFDGLLGSRVQGLANIGKVLTRPWRQQSHVRVLCTGTAVAGKEDSAGVRGRTKAAAAKGPAL
jgi:hypothetical protein